MLLQKLKKLRGALGLIINNKEGGEEEDEEEDKAGGAPSTPARASCGAATPVATKRERVKALLSELVDLLVNQVSFSVLAGFVTLKWQLRNVTPCYCKLRNVSQYLGLLSNIYRLGLALLVN